jgi:hypothetical protein
MEFPSYGYVLCMRDIDRLDPTGTEESHSALIASIGIAFRWLQGLSQTCRAIDAGLAYRIKRVSVVNGESDNRITSTILPSWCQLAV